MIERIDISKLRLYKVLFRCRKSLVVNDEDLCFFSFFRLISVFYFIEANIWIKTTGFIPERRLARRIGY